MHTLQNDLLCEIKHRPEKRSAGFPCLYRINSTEIAPNDTTQPFVTKGFELSTQHRKSAFALAMNIEHLIDKVGLERVGFMTLTFGHNRGNRQQYQC